ncbi:MAG: hypothetical protein [Cressdnaviricota sp.]|nr:MAG: hypothetical protein [Cressdnaviricota sp.]
MFPLRRRRLCVGSSSGFSDFSIWCATPLCSKPFVVGLYLLSNHGSPVSLRGSPSSGLQASAHEFVGCRTVAGTRDTASVRGVLVSFHDRISERFGLHGLR